MKPKITPKSTYDAPREITGLFQFGETETKTETGEIKRRKIAALLVGGVPDTPEGQKSVIYAVELNPLEKGSKKREVYRPLLNIIKNDGDEVKQYGVVFKIDDHLGKLIDPATKKVLGKARAFGRSYEFKEIELTEDGERIFSITKLFPRKDASGKNEHLIAESTGKIIGKMVGDWDNGPVELEVNGTKLSAEIESTGKNGFKYRVLLDSNSEYNHPNRTAYPTGPILIEEVGNKLMQVARAKHSTSKSGKPMLKFLFNGQERSNAYVFFKDDSNDNSIVEFNEKNELVEIGKFNGNKDSQHVEIELGGKKYSYVVPIGNVMFNNKQTERKRMPAEPNVLPYNLEENPLKISDLLRHYFKYDKRRLRDWKDLKGSEQPVKTADIAAKVEPKVTETKVTETKTAENEEVVQAAPVRRLKFRR